MNNETANIVVGLAFAFVLLMGAVGVVMSDKELEPSIVAEPEEEPEEAVPDTLRWFMPENDVDYQTAVQLARDHLMDHYGQSFVVIRPRNFMVTFVASNPTLLDVRILYWLEDMSTRLVQSCDGTITIKRGMPATIADIGIRDIECE